MLNVLALSGIRSEYFLQRPALNAIAAHPELNLQLVVAGAHLSPLHNYTVKTIEDDGFTIVERIENLLYSDRDAARLKGAAIELAALANVVDRLRPDWLFAVGDREEPMMLALCGAYLNIPTMHYCAGDRVVGNVDDMVRHAASRLAHVLLTTSEDARARLIRAGEEESRVHRVGHAGLDRMRLAPSIDRASLAERLGVPSVPERYAVVIQHALSSEISESGMHMRETLEGVLTSGLDVFVSYPNSDPGCGDIIEVIESYREHDGVHLFRNIEDDLFVNLLRGASVLVGNSSLGLLEAPFLKLPVINAGNRQKQRHHAENVFFTPNARGAIADQIDRILHDAEIKKRIEGCGNPFGDGHAGERIADLLAKTLRDAALLNKDLAY
ncbi:UDP-N-acetylglucosamine 2-epimerase [Halochromatium roseum]|uniref:UDP-N-acetylglucosamine 2-epimerase n=1 Tax=Halochromatium roseum TaxID=391920 RepID=UPI001913317C|nr:UDP-N-acetylglucosamine 2-epimerase [Halochromatium roseum]MBK5941183.1 UDP-N-acetylglucosamine 2-epimerase (hydrolyzing) [Halochromatium roseum]